MCGIAGIVRWGKQPISEETLAILLVGNEHRGNDAAGIAIQQENGTIDILKQDCPGWKLVLSPEYEAFIKKYLQKDSRCVLLHARGASQGNPRDNNNNHPMSAGAGAVVHNGVIRNDDFLFTQNKLERKAETDSDILRAIVDSTGITKDTIKKIGTATGSGTIAALHPDFPGQLLLIRSGNPLTLASNEDFFYFSSEKATLHKACRPFVKRMGMWFQAQKPNVDFANMANHVGWIIGPKGLIEHAPCEICNGPYTEPWRKTYEEYATRQAKWDSKLRVAHRSEDVAMKPAWCPDCKKEWVIPIDAIYSQYTCNAGNNGCGKTLWKPPAIPMILGARGERVN